MAATAILDFEKFAYLTRGINTSWYQVYAVKICWKSLHPCRNYEFFRNSRWPFWIFKNFHIWRKGSILAGTRCMLLKFCENRFIHAEIMIFWNSKRWPPPSWILQNLHIWPKRSILAGTRCTLLKFGENRFIHAEIMIFFSKFKMAAAAIFDFPSKICISDSRDQY